MPARHRPVATLATVAAAAGVSRQTVSNALNSPELLRPDTLERVQRAIDRLGYTPNRAARNLRTRTSHLVGLRLDPAVEGTASGLMDRFLHSLVESCKEAGLHVLLFTAEDVNDPLDGYDALLRSAAVDAFVVTDTYRGNPQAAWLEERQVPFVAFGRPWDDPQALLPVGRRRRPRRGPARRRPPRRPGPPADRLGRLAEVAPTSARTGAAAGSTGCTSASCPPPGSAPAGEDTIEFGRRAAHALLRGRAADRVRVRQRHRRDGRAPGDRRPRPPARARTTSPWSASTTRSPRRCTGLTSVRQPLEEVAVQIVRLLEDRLVDAHQRRAARDPHPRAPGPRHAPDADAVGAQNRRHQRLTA